MFGCYKVGLPQKTIENNTEWREKKRKKTHHFWHFSWSVQLLEVGHIFRYTYCTVKSAKFFLGWLFRIFFWSSWSLKRMTLSFSKWMEYFPLKVTYLKTWYIYIYNRHWLVSFLYSIHSNNHGAPNDGLQSLSGSQIFERQPNSFNKISGIFRDPQ